MAHTLPLASPVQVLMLPERPRVSDGPSDGRVVLPTSDATFRNVPAPVWEYYSLVLSPSGLSFAALVPTSAWASLASAASERTWALKSPTRYAPFADQERF